MAQSEPLPPGVTLEGGRVKANGQYVDTHEGPSYTDPITGNSWTEVISIINPNVDGIQELTDPATNTVYFKYYLHKDKNYNGYWISKKSPIGKHDCDVTRAACRKIEVAKQEKRRNTWLGGLQSPRHPPTKFICDQCENPCAAATATATATRGGRRRMRKTKKRATLRRKTLRR
jgi:hypothetical protein